MPPLHDPDVWLFDLDNTLNPARCNLFAQIDVRIGRYIAECLKVDLEEARRMQKQYWRDHGTSMRGMMTLHGVDPRHYLDYVHDIDYSPIPPSPELDAALARLAGRKIIFTAGDVPHAERVMERLGVAHHFEAIFDIVAGDCWRKGVPRSEDPDPGRRRGRRLLRGAPAAERRGCDLPAARAARRQGEEGRPGDQKPQRRRHACGEDRHQWRRGRSL